MRRSLSVMLAAALAAGILTGCSPAERKPEGGSVTGYAEEDYRTGRVRREFRDAARDFMADGAYRAGRNGRVKGETDMGRDMGEKAKDILKDTEKGMKKVGRATGRAAHEIGRAARKAGRDVADEIRKP